MSPNRILTSIRNDGRQLALIYDQYRSEFLHWIAREFRCSSEDSKDIYQATILIFYDNVRCGKLRHLISSVKTYLFGVGKNVAREHLRKLKRNSAICMENTLKEFAADDAPVDESFFEAANKALARLSSPARKIIELFYYERKSMKEICALLNYKNPETAKNQKCKSMARLRKLFEEEVGRGWVRGV